MLSCDVSVANSKVAQERFMLCNLGPKDARLPLNNTTYNICRDRFQNVYLTWKIRIAAPAPLKDAP